MVCSWVDETGMSDEAKQPGGPGQPHEPAGLSDRERRVAPRRSMTARVVLQLPALDLEGIGQNVSASGLSLVVPTPIEVEVQVDGDPEIRRGELVRLSPMAGGGSGIAVRFVVD